MLRTMRLDRPGLMLLILSLPIPEAAAGPIFTHSSGAAGTRGWVQGNTGHDLPGPSSTGLIGEVPWVSLWSDVQPGRPGGFLASDPSGHPPWQSPVEASTSTGDQVPPHAATAPSMVNEFRASPAAAAPPLSSPAPPVGNPSASSQASTPSVPAIPGPRGADISGRAVGVSSVAEKPATSSSRGVPASSPSASSNAPVATGQGTGPASSNPGGPVAATPLAAATSPQTPGCRDIRSRHQHNGSSGRCHHDASFRPGCGRIHCRGLPDSQYRLAQPGAALSSNGAGPSIPQAPGVTTPMNGTAVSMPPGASAASPISATSMAMLAAAGSSIPATGSSSQGTATSATNSMGGANPPGISSRRPGGGRLDDHRQCHRRRGDSRSDD